MCAICLGAVKFFKQHVYKVYICIIYKHFVCMYIHIVCMYIQLVYYIVHYISPSINLSIFIYIYNMNFIDEIFFLLGTGTRDCRFEKDQLIFVKSQTEHKIIRQVYNNHVQQLRHTTPLRQHLFTNVQGGPQMFP